MSADSCQPLVDGLMALRYEIQDMGQRIEDLVALRKQQFHRAKKVNAEEYEQALNSPSMMILYEDYKEAYPFAYKDKEAIISHVTTANEVLSSARKGLLKIERNKDALYHIMAQATSQHASHLFEKGNHHALESSIVLVYALHDVPPQDVQRACEIATETFAKKILNWPNGRLDKPEIFKFESHDGQLRDSNDCFERFVSHLHDVFEASPPKDLPVYPHAFVIMDGSCLEKDATAMLVLAYKPEDEWRVGHCSVPIEVELGLAVESLRLGDVFEGDLLNQFSDQAY
ncbi:hypothetical protein FCOIX_4172 [Fusarium coicis]|nr:hypothetical protein FCOIX_4172 [Fusarium coicis]